MSPGSVGATVSSPPDGAEKVLMKKLSPPRTDRLNPFSMPPCAFVSISTPPDMLVIAPASALTSPPGGSVMTPRAKDGLYRISTCM